MLMTRLIFAGYALVLAGRAIATPNISAVARNVHAFDPQNLPFYLGGGVEDQQAHPYGPDVLTAPHTAEGPGLFSATTGSPTSFTIRLSRENGTKPEREWMTDKKRFIYVWIASADHVFTAGVENNGDGSLTATYESRFPGTYFVYIEDVDLYDRDEYSRGQPIVGSPFSLTISGEPSLDVDALPVCGTEEEDTASMYWRPGSWISANLASAKHGVLRNGWVFQPKTCVHDTFSYEDLILLASLDEPTWLLALGNSILRGVFLALVDMVLVQGQKDELETSVVQKCWGFADIRVGNLRLTYQDMRLYTVRSVEDSTICNDEKLKSGSTTAFVKSAELFFEQTIFQDGEPWPNVIWAPSNMVDLDEAPNVQISVLVDALPAQWNGTLFMMDHMYGYGHGWNTGNPTLEALNGVKPVNEHSVPSSDSGIGRMDRYRQRNPPTVFMSVFPMYQAHIFENEKTRVGKRCYGCSIHFHYVLNSTSPETHNGSQVVFSSVVEMLANIMLSKAVGTKAVLYDKIAATSDIHSRSAEVEKKFKVCTDCPATLIPYHVKPTPELKCETVTSLPGNASTGKAWNEERCPDWCLTTEPVGQTPTGPGMVDVRVCEAGKAPP